MRMLLREIDSRADGCEMVSDILEVLLVKIVRRGRRDDAHRAAPPSKSKEMVPPPNGYIDENFSENITLDKLADHPRKQILPSTLPAGVQHPPINYLLNRRITESKGPC